MSYKLNVRVVLLSESNNRVKLIAQVFFFKPTCLTKTTAALKRRVAACYSCCAGAAIFTKSAGEQEKKYAKVDFVACGRTKSACY